MPILVGFLRPLPFFPYHPIGGDTKQSGGNRGGKIGSRRFVVQKKSPACGERTGLVTVGETGSEDAANPDRITGLWLGKDPGF
jgi:hypothetical protein